MPIKKRKTIRNFLRGKKPRALQGPWSKKDRQRFRSLKGMQPRRASQTREGVPFDPKQIRELALRGLAKIREEEQTMQRSQTGRVLRTLETMFSTQIRLPPNKRSPGIPNPQLSLDLLRGLGLRGIDVLLEAGLKDEDIASFLYFLADHEIESRGPIHLTNMPGGVKEAEIDLDELHKYFKEKRAENIRWKSELDRRHLEPPTPFMRKIRRGLSSLKEDLREIRKLQRSEKWKGKKPKPLPTPEEAETLVLEQAKREAELHAEACLKCMRAVNAFKKARLPLVYYTGA